MIASVVIGKTHKSVLGFLYPIKITLPLYIKMAHFIPKYHNTSHFAHYAYSNQGRDREVGDDVSLENIWEPWQFEVTNVDLTTFPSGQLMLSGFVMGLIFFMGVRPFSYRRCTGIRYLPCVGGIVGFPGCTPETTSLRLSLDPETVLSPYPCTSLPSCHTRGPYSSVSSLS